MRTIIRHYSTLYKPRLDLNKLKEGLNKFGFNPAAIKKNLFPDITLARIQNNLTNVNAKRKKLEFTVQDDLKIIEKKMAENMGKKTFKR